MNKLTKLLSVFVIAGAVGTGVSFAAGCGHRHSYSEDWASDETTHWHAATCEHSELKDGVDEHHDVDKNLLCDECGYDLATHVTKVTLNATTKTLKIGEEFTLEATVLPANASINTYTWSSSAPAVAEVVNGKVTAKAAGEAVITVTTTDSAKTAHCTITVEGDTPTPEKTTIELGDNNLALKKRETAEVELKLDSSFVGKKIYVFSYDSVELTTAENTEASAGVLVTYAEGLKVTVKYTGEEDGEANVQVLNVLSMGDNTVTAASGSNIFAINVTEELEYVTVTVEGETDGTVGFRNRFGNELATETTAEVVNGIAIIDLTNNGDASKSVTLKAAKEEKGGPEFNGTTLTLDTAAEFSAEGFDVAFCKITLKAGDYALKFTDCDVANVYVEMATALNAEGDGIDYDCQITAEDGAFTLEEDATVYILLSANDFVSVSGKITVSEDEGEQPDPETYTVTYVINGHGEQPNVVADVTALPATLPELTEEGWTFDGWYLDEAFTEANKAVAGAAITANTKLYAKWTKKTVSVTGITLSRTEVTLKVGASTTIKATIAPENATNKNRTRVSSDTSVATIDENGTIKAVGVGEATITIKTEDGGFEATCKVKVEPATIAVTGVSFEHPELELEVDGTHDIHVTLTPANATNKDYKVVSSDPEVVSIDGDVFVANKVGTATITVTTTDGNKTATCKVTVKERTSETVKVTGISLDKTTLNLKVGESEKITATIAPANATNQRRTRVSSDTSVATIDENGNVKAVGVGTATITIKTVEGGFEATCTVTVSPATIAVKGVTLDATTLNLTVGGTHEFEATITPEDADNQEVTYKSSDPEVAKMVGNMLTALKAGTATITVTTADGGFTATCAVTVVRDTFTVTYEINGHGSQPDEKTDVKALPSTLPTLTAEGWIFDGWYTDAEFKTPAVEGAKITADTTLYAKWTEKSIYEKLMDRTSEHLVTTPAAGTTIGNLNGYYKTGIYVENGSSTVKAEGTDTVIAQVNSGNTNLNTYFVLGPVKGVVEGYFETKVSAKASSGSQNLIDFCDASGSQLKIDSTGNFRYTVKGGTATETTIEFAKDKYYAIYFKFDLTTGKATVKIGDTTILDDADTGITSLSYVKLLTTDSGKRLHTTKNLVICGTKLTADEYRTTAQKAIDNAYYSMIGKAAEGETAAIPATHSKNAATITEAYNAINLTSVTTIDAMLEEVDKFVGLNTSIDSDAKINAQISASTTELNEFKTANASKYETNAEAYNEAIEAAIASLANAKSVAQVKELASTEHLLDDIKSDAKIEEEAFAAEKVNAANVLKADWEAYLAANADVAASDYVNDIKTAYDAATEAVGAATTSKAVKDAIAEFNKEKAAALKKGDVDEYKLTKAEELVDYAKAITDELDATEDAALIASINSARDSYETEIKAFSKANSNTTQQVDAKLLEAETAIDRLVAKGELAKYATANLALVHGDSTAAGTATTAINTAKSSGDDAIDAAAKTEIAGKLTTAKTAIDTAISTLNGTEFTVTISGVQGVTAAKVKYGNKVVLNESGIADTVMVKDWYTSEAKTTKYDFEAPVYGDVTLYADTVAAVKETHRFNYAQLDVLTGGTQLEAFQGTDNAFLTLADGTVQYRTETNEKDSAGNANRYLQVQGNVFSVEFKGAGTLTLELRGTGDGKVAPISLQKTVEAGEESVFASLADTSKVKVYDNYVYGVSSSNSNHVSVTFVIETAGTYTLCVHKNVTKNGVAVDNTAENISMGRLSKIEQVMKYEAVAVDSVAIAPKEGEWAANKTYDVSTGTLALKATIDPSNASYTHVIWDSKNKDVATVDENGVVTFIKKGTAKITATVEVDGNNSEVTITVADSALEAKITAAKAKLDQDYPKDNYKDEEWNGEIIGNQAEYEEAFDAALTAFEATTTEAELEEQVEIANRTLGAIQKTADLKLTQFNVKFYDGATEYTELAKQVADGSTVVKPVDPEKAGYKFKAWYTTEDFATDTEFVFTTAITAALADDENVVKLYAKFAEAYTVNFYVDGEKVRTDVIEVADGVVATAPTFEDKTDYTFDGYYTAADYTGDKWEFTNELSADNTDSNRVLNLYGKWVEVKADPELVADAKNFTAIASKDANHVVDANYIKINNKQGQRVVTESLKAKASVTVGDTTYSYGDDAGTAYNVLTTSNPTRADDEIDLLLATGKKYRVVVVWAAKDTTARLVEIGTSAGEPKGTATIKSRDGLQVLDEEIDLTGEGAVANRYVNCSKNVYIYEILIYTL